MITLKKLRKMEEFYQKMLETLLDNDQYLPLKRILKV